MAIVTTVATPPLFHILYVKGVLAARKQQADAAALELADKGKPSGTMDISLSGAGMQHEDSFDMDADTMQFASAFQEAHRIARESNAADDIVVDPGHRSSSGTYVRVQSCFVGWYIGSS